MTKLIELVEEIPQVVEEMTFSEVLRNARDKVGLLQYRVAEHLRMNIGRLKNLETGYFRGMPQSDEIRNICEFYGLDVSDMIEKAEKQLADREVKKNYG